MTVPNNNLQTVQTYQMSGLAALQNLNCFISTFNTKFENFQDMTANLGNTVTFNKPSRFTVSDSLVANFQPADQRVHSLTVNKSASISYAFTNQEMVFNVRDYMAVYGRAAAIRLGAKVEGDVARNCITAPYRFYGNGVTAINSYAQLASAVALMENYGVADGGLKGYLLNTTYPAITNSGLNQFVLKRNDEIAKSWEIGNFSNCDWHKSNMLPVHTAGTAGQQGLVLTVVSTTLDSYGAVIAITFSISGSPGADPNMVQNYDKFQFKFGVSGQPNMYYLGFTSYLPSEAPVQFRATAQAASTSGSQVTVSIYPPLQANATNEQNISYPIVAGMQCTVLPSHRAGMIVTGNAAYLAMPRLPEQTPFPSANMVDPDTGISFLQYYGVQFGQNNQSMIHSCIWGSTVVPEYSLMIAFPL